MVEKDLDFIGMLRDLDDPVDDAASAASATVLPQHAPAMDFALPGSTNKLIEDAVGARESDKAKRDAADKGTSFIEGLMDPQQYVEGVKGIVPGAIQFGGTIVASPDTVTARGQQGAAKFGRNQLDVMNRIDRGEYVPEMDDAAGYQHMTPEQRAKARTDQEEATIAFNPTRVQDRPFYKAGEAIQKFGKELIPAAPGYEEAKGRQIGEGLGSLVAGLPFAYFGTVPAGIAFGGAGVGEATQRAVQFDQKERAAGRPGLTEDQITLAGMLGIGPGATDLLPVEVLMGRLPLPLPTVLRRPVAQAIGRIGGQAFIEGVQEGGQNFLQNLIAREVYNSDQKLMDGVQEGSEIGAGVGGIAQTAKEIGMWLIKSGAVRRTKGVHDSLAHPKPATPSGEQATIDPDTRTLAPSQEGPTPRLKPGEGAVRGATPSDPVLDDVNAFLTEIEGGTIAKPDSGRTDQPTDGTPVIGSLSPQDKLDTTAPAPTPVPTWKDISAVLPPDANGDPDLGPVFDAIAAAGKRSFGELTNEAKVGLIESLRGKTHAATAKPAEQATDADFDAMLRQSLRTKFDRYLELERQSKLVTPDDPTPGTLFDDLVEAQEDLLEEFRIAGLPGDSMGRVQAINSVDDIRRAFSRATPEQRQAYWAAAPERVPALPSPAAASRKAAGAVSAPEAPTVAPAREAAPAAPQAAPRSLTEAIQQAAPQIEEAARAAVEAIAPPAQEAAQPAAPAIDDAVRSRFSEVLASKERRSSWAKAAGISEDQAQALIAEAVSDGRLTMRKGQPVRTGKAKQVSSPQAEVAKAATSVPMGRAAEVRLERIQNDVAYKHAAALLGAGTNTRLRNAALKKLVEDKKATRVVLDEVHLALTGKPSKSMRKKGDVIEALRKADIAQAAPAPVAAPVVEEESVPLQDIVNPIDRNAPVEDQLRQIAELTAQSKPALDAQLKAMDAQIGTTSNSNIKKPETIVSKASRPSILATKPWHTIAHIRDTLRFQTKITSFDQIEKAAEFMLSQGYRIVKIDTAKMLQPKEWGWRFAGFDLRAPNGQLVEWYIIFDQMYVAKKKGHLLFEKWRNATEAERTEKQDEYEADIASSYRLYTDSFEAGLRNSGYSGLDDARADISRLSASLPEMAAKFSATSSAAGGTYSPLGSQAPSAAGRNLEAPGSGSMTQQRPESRSSSTTGSSISDTSSQFEGGSAIPFDNAADSRIQIAAAPPGDSYAIRTLQSINDPVVKGHYEALARSGTAVEPALGAIASDRRLDAVERQQLAELYVGEPVSGDPVQAIRDTAERRGNDLTSALLHGFSPEVSPSNLRVRDDIVQRLEAMAQRLPQDVDLVIKSALRMYDPNVGVRRLEGGLLGDRGADEVLGMAIPPFKKVLAVSLEYGPDVAMRTFTHEEIHALRETGVLKKGKEWDTLAGIAKRRPKKAEAERILKARREQMGEELFKKLNADAGKLTYRELYNIDATYGDYYKGDESKLIEETVAHAAADWADGRQFAAPIERVFMKVRDFLEAIRNALVNGLGFRSANDIFESIWAGDFVRKFEEAEARRAEGIDSTREWMGENGVIAMAVGAGRGKTDGMSPEERKARAEELGFDTSKVWYHGTSRWEKDGKKLGDFSSFDRMASANIVGRKVSMDTVGSWFSDEGGADGASMYAGKEGAVYPVYLAVKNPWRPKSFDEFLDKFHTSAGRSTKQSPRGVGSAEELRAWLKSEGYDGIVFPAGTVDGNKQTVIVALEPNQVRSVSAAFDPEAADSPNLMAAFAGERATTADLNALNAAKEMDAAGEPREDIWKQTGWFKGVDGRWRFEIDDSKSKLRAFGPDFSLLQVELTHEELFKAYPQMAEVEYDRIPGNGGSFMRGGILPSTMEVGKAAKNRRSVTLHESQHGLQDIEGFARGGSPRYVTPDEIRAEQELLRSTRVADDGWTTVGTYAPDDEVTIRYNLYQRLAGEVEARTVEKRLSLTPEQRANRAPWLDYDVPESQQIVRMPDGSGQAMMSVELDGDVPTLPPADVVDLGFPSVGASVRPQFEAAQARWMELRRSLPDEIRNNAYKHGWSSKNMLEWSRSEWATKEEKAWAPLIEKHAETIDAVRVADRESNRLAAELDKGGLAASLTKLAQEPRPADPAMMVYHGTEADFRKFSGEAARERADTTRKFDADVIFVTPNKAFAEGYGTPVPLELRSGFYFDLENQHDLARIAPFINSRPDAQKFWDRIEKGGQTWGMLESAEMFAELKRLGYDGAMMSEQYHTATNVRLARTIAVFTQGKVSHRGTDDVMFSFRDWLPSRGPTPPQATDQGDSPGLNKIISDLKKTLGMPVSQGLWGMTVQQGNRSARVRPPSNVKGQFDRETGNVSVRQSRDIKTLAHEGGHYLESILGADLGVVKQGYAEALTGDANAMPAALSEGFARWFESYILDPQAAEARAPGMTEAFEELLEAERPDMLGAFDTIQNEYQRYITSAPIGEVAAGLSSQYDGTTWRELSADKALDNVSGKLSSAYQGVVDGLNVAAKGVQYLLKTADANGIRDADGRPISIKVGDNFYKRLRLFSGAFSRGRAWLEKGVSDLETGQIIGPSLKAALDKAMGDGKFDMKRYKEFNQYLVSIRAIEEYNRLDQKAATVQQYDNTLERLAAARPTVTERVTKDQATLDRRQDALTRTNALLSDRRRMLGAAETRLENTQERLQGILDDIAEADEAFRLAGEIADPVASRAVSENYRNMVTRRRRSMQIAERDQQQALRLVERLSEEVSGLGIESTALEAEIAQRREMVAKGRQQIAQLDDTVTRLRRDRERANSAGASRAPTAEPRSVHERVIAEMGTPEFQEAAQLVHDFTFSLLEARRQAGFISQELFDELAKRKDWYVPFWRDMSDIEGAGTMFPGSGVKKWSMFKKFDGSDRSILMPLEVLSEEAYSTAQQIAFNDVVKTMVGLAERVGPGGGKVAERLARAENMEANDETFGKIKQKAIELGVDPLDAHMITQRMEMNFSDGDIRVILSPENLGPTAKPQLPLWENGERVMVRLPDPAFGRDLFEAINGLGKEMSDILVKALALPAQMLRIGVTSHPDFIFRNIWRDMWTAWKLTGAVPVITQARGFRLIGEGGQVDGMPGEDFRRLYNEAGGVAGGMNLNVEVADSKRDVKALLDTNIDKKAIAAGGALLGFTGVAAGSSIGSMLGLVFGGPVGAGVGFKVGATVGGLVGGLGGGYAARHGEVWKVVESFETATRLGVAAHAYKRAKAHNPDLSDMEAITEAAFVSRDILDWNRRGSKMLAATRLVTFLNAQIQGLDKQLRQMSAQGDRGSVLKKHLGIVFKHQSNDILSVDEQRDLADAYKSYLRWGAISLMLMGLYALSGDDDDYQDIKDQTKWTHSWFKSLGIWFRLPKPFELAVPSNIGEILWDKYRGYDQRAAERVVDSMYEVLAPPGLPQVMRLAGGVMFNRDRQGIFKGQSREIVGENLASRPPHERYHAFSSEFAIDLSRAMYQAGVPQSLIPAPVKTDFVLSAAGAYWGREVQNSYQTAKTVVGMSTRPDRKVTDIPLLRGVTGEAARQSESVSEMYTMISREGGEMTMAATEYKQLMDDRGRPAEAEVWLKSLDKDQQVWALTQYYGSKSDKREHPLERARQADSINREIMRDTITDTLAPKVRQGRKQVRDFEDKIELTPAKKTEVIDILARLSQVEARNTMVLLERRGFEGMSIKDPELIMQELKAASKPVYDLLMERRDKKVEDWPSVQREWPRYRERVLKQGVQAF